MVKLRFCVRAILGLLLLTSTVVAQEQDEDYLKIGGALRFNYNYSTWKDKNAARGGDFGFEIFRLDVNARYKKIKLNVDYRIYSAAFGGTILKMGELEFHPGEKSSVYLGLTQVPFGNQKYNSHGWFFNLPFYVGLEDDYDMGVKYIFETDKSMIQLGFFKNAEELVFANDAGISARRYSYDVGGDNKETNQGNVKYTYFLSSDKKTDISISAMYGGLYNWNIDKMGSHYAFALGFQTTKGAFNAKLQSIYYNKDASDLSANKKSVEMVAYNAIYDVAAEAYVHTVGVSYDIPVSMGAISNIQLYSDFGVVQKPAESYEDSYKYVLGCLLTAGNVYTYFDAAFGKNNPWLGPEWGNGLAEGNPDAVWHMRFNVNLGYYF
jgi:hypothetical protein